MHTHVNACHMQEIGERCNQPSIIKFSLKYVLKIKYPSLHCLIKRRKGDSFIQIFAKIRKISSPLARNYVVTFTKPLVSLRYLKDYKVLKV